MEKVSCPDASRQGISQDTGIAGDAASFHGEMAMGLVVAINISHSAFALTEELHLRTISCVALAASRGSRSLARSMQLMLKNPSTAPMDIPLACTQSGIRYAAPGEWYGQQSESVLLIWRDSRGQDDCERKLNWRLWGRTARRVSTRCPSHRPPRIRRPSNSTRPPVPFRIGAA